MVKEPQAFARSKVSSAIFGFRFGARRRRWSCSGGYHRLSPSCCPRCGYRRALLLVSVLICSSVVGAHSYARRVRRIFSDNIVWVLHMGLSSSGARLLRQLRITWVLHMGFSDARLLRQLHTACALHMGFFWR